MCPGHVPGSRSETVRERSTTRAEASAFRSILLLSLECFEKPVSLEAQLLRVADSEGTVHFAKVRVGEDADDYLRLASCGSILPFVAYSDDRRAARACYELGRKPHRYADSTVALVPLRSPFPA